MDYSQQYDNGYPSVVPIDDDSSDSVVEYRGNCLKKLYWEILLHLSIARGMLRESARIEIFITKHFTLSASIEAVDMKKTKINVR